MLVQSLQTLQKSSASARKATEESLRPFLLNAFAGLPQNGDLRIHACVLHRGALSSRRTRA